MLYLSLVRHGKSSWQYPDLLDFERPLNNRGWRDVPLVAQYYQAQGYAPDLLISSFATRALTTARLFARALQYPVERMQISETLYECNVSDVYGTLAALPEGPKHVALFGHNPAFTDFLNGLCGEQLDNLPTAAYAYLSMAVAQWPKVAPGCAKLLELKTPKSLR